MTNQNITQLDISDSRWLEFIQSNSDATIFHHPQWITLLGDCYHFKPSLLVSLNKEGAIEGGIPLIQTKTILNQEKWVSLPFTDHCAPIFQKEDAIAKLISYLENRSQEKKGLRIELRWNYSGDQQLHKSTDFYLHKLNLASDEEEIANRIHSKDFRQIKVAYQRGVRIESGTSLKQVKAFYQLHTLTRRRKGIPVQPWRFFELLQRNILAAGSGFVVLAYEGRECLAGAIFLNWNRTLIYKYSASIEKARFLLAMDPILWTAICWGCRNGYRTLDMGRTETTNDGLAKFKQRWGAERIPLTYSFLGPPSLNSSSMRWMPLLHTIIRKSPPWVARLVGEGIYRYAA